MVLLTLFLIGLAAVAARLAMLVHADGYGFVPPPVKRQHEYWPK